MTRKFILLYVFVLVMPCLCFAQLSEIRQLQQQLKHPKDSLDYLCKLNKIGLLIHLKNADSSFYYGIQGNALADRLNAPKEKAHAMSNIATGLLLKGLYSQSLQYFGKAYNIYQANNNKPEIAQGLMNQAITYSFIGDSAKAIRFATRANNFTHKYLMRDSAASMLMANYVELNSGLAKDSVAWYLSGAEKIAIKFNDQRTLVFIGQIRANRFIDAKQPAMALPIIMRSLAITRANNWDYHEMESLNNLGSYYLAVNKTDSALAAYLEIYKKAKANNYVYWKIDVLKDISKCYKFKNDKANEYATAQLLIVALEQDNTANNSFLGDYIQYNQTQEELKKLGLSEGLNHKKIVWLFVACGAGSLVILLLILFYWKVTAQAKKLSEQNLTITVQNEALKESDVFKGRLLSMLAHDFRSPLNSTISMVQLLRDHEAMEPEELAGLYRLIETDINEVLLTFDNILQWTHKQLTGYILQPVKVNLKESINEAFSFFHEQANARQITIVNEIDATLAPLTDQEIIRFIDRNLLHNAIKYSPIGGKITALSVVKNKEIIITIKDEGVGLTEKLLKELFTGKISEINDSAQGAGLALNICAEFIQKLGGRIWVGKSAGKGAEFSYAIPLRASE
ncbi:HAMP domain-containing histidine kinase [Mucilaginibacter sp. RB4R14]|uniref:sensor histidine kinase n=1 Tax=Mucilaginibacter aurantiaciroseus TaxID=2949308 RepID=UPI002090FCE1|nr:tetratricopeptide repeat-containing sensor histidine kinase [Mucilaginibacter aurantiaciroseus]MCO5936374.1 HAMP domain-containing histidine kinase [Mucilaginibacter aurantiaciroseus]